MATYDRYASPAIHPSAVVDESVVCGEFVEIGAGGTIEQDVRLGNHVTIGEHVDIKAGSFIDTWVKVGPWVYIGEEVLILAGAKVCPDKVKSASSDGRTLRSGVIVGPNVKLHNEVELGVSAIIPSQRTIAHIGSLGEKNRVVTIYGSDDGPRYSVGCQLGITYNELKSRVAGSVATDEHSANTYTPYLGIFNEMGKVVQLAYDGEATLVRDLKSMHTEMMNSRRGTTDMSKSLVIPSPDRFSLELVTPLMSPEDQTPDYPDQAHLTDESRLQLGAAFSTAVNYEDLELWEQGADLEQ